RTRRRGPRAVGPGTRGWGRRTARRRSTPRSRAAPRPSPSPRRGTRSAGRVVAGTRADDGGLARPVRDRQVVSDRSRGSLLDARGEPDLECGARAMEVRLHRAEGDAQCVRDLLIGELLEVAEGESGGVGIVGDPQRDVVHASSVSLDQGREGFGVPCKTPLNGLLVGAHQGAPTPPSWAPSATGTPPASEKFRVSWHSRWT